MIVNYFKTGVWLIQHGKMVDAPKDAEGKQIQEKTWVGGNVKLIPGLNTVADKDWAEICDHPDVQAALDHGTLEIVEGPATGKKKESGAGDIESLEKYDQKKAISIVGGQMDADVLANWRRKEKRPMVLKALKEQAEQVAAADAAFKKD